MWNVAEFIQYNSVNSDDTCIVLNCIYTAMLKESDNSVVFFCSRNLITAMFFLISCNSHLRLCQLGMCLAYLHK